MSLRAKTLFAIAALILLAPYSAIADITSPHARVQQIHFWWGHTGALIIHEQMISGGGCSRGDQYILPISHPNYEHVYALIMAAHFSDRPIQFVLGGCHEGFPVIKHVRSRNDTT